MKKTLQILLSTLVAIFSVYSVSLAWTGPTLTPPFGNLPPPLNLGSTEQTKPGGLVLNTAGLPVGLIVRYGRVGIGMTAPAETLDVAGNIRIGQNAKISSVNSIGAISDLITFNNDNFLRLGMSGGNGIIFGSNIASNLGAYANNTYNIGSDASRFASIYGTNGYFGSGLGLGTISQDPNFKITTVGGGLKAKGADNGTSNYSLYTENTDGVVLAVRNDGRVGVGTASPAYTFDVANGQIRGQYIWARPGTTSGRIYVTNQADVTSIYLDGNTGANSYINTANVGIGTTAPTAKLHIGGTAGVDGIKFPDGTLQTTAAGGGWSTATGKVYTTTITDKVGIGTTNPNNKLEVKNLISFVDASNNTFIGQNSDSSNSGSNNTFVGSYTGMYNTTGSGNTFIGTGATASALTGSHNTTLGSFAGAGLTGAANNNTLLGYQAGNSITSGAGNIIIGNDVDTPTATTGNYLNIGNTIYGNLSTGSVGIGTTGPRSKLDVRDTIYVGTTGSTHGVINSDDGIYFNSESDNNGSDAFFAFGTDRSTVSGGTEWMRIINGGNVGIGTATPGAKLHVVGNIILPDANTLYGAKFGTTDYSTMTFNSRAWSTVQGANGPAFSFTTHSDAGGGGYEAMRINYGESGSILFKPTGGYGVGVGVASIDANYKLTTSGGGVKAENSSATEPAGFFNNLSTGPDLKVDTGGIKFSDGTIQTTAAGAAGGDLTVANFRASGIANFGTGMSSPNVQIYNNQMYTTSSAFWIGTSASYAFNLGTQSATNMTLLPGGNIGIGTATPLNKLHIYGGDGVEQLIQNSGQSTGNQLWGIQAYTGNLNFRTLNDNASAETGVGKVLTLTRAGNVGVGVLSPSEKLEVNGNVKATAFYYSSDKTLKNNIQPLSGSLNKILKLQGVSFDWKENNKSSIGLIAQDVEMVYPELVSTSKETGLKSVEYANLVAPLIESIKEQQRQIEELRAEIQELKNK